MSGEVVRRTAATAIFNDPTGAIRLATRVEPDGDCLRWTGRRNYAGYGDIKIQGVRTGVHRAAYALAYGPIPAGLEIDHLCGVRDCIRPEHLRAVTHRENVRSQERPSRNPTYAVGESGPIVRDAPKTHCPEGHPYDEENTLHRQGARRCRICRKAWNKQRQPCPDCGAVLQRANLTSHRRHVHGLAVRSQA